MNVARIETSFSDSSPGEGFWGGRAGGVLDYVIKLGTRDDPVRSWRLVQTQVQEEGSEEVEGEAY